MKKAIFALLIFLLLLFPQDIKAYANTDTEVLDEEINNALNNLDYSELEDFFKALDDNNKYSFGNSVKQILSEILNGKGGFSGEKILSIIMNNLKQSIFSMLPMILTILTIGVLYGISSSMTSSFLKKSTNEIIYYVCFGAIIIVLITTITSVFNDVKRTIDVMNVLVDVSFPILLTLVTALGGLTSVAIYQPAIAIFSSVIIKVIINIILPLFLAGIVFCLIGSLSNNIKLDKLTKTTTSAAEWILGIIFTLFIAFITAEGIIGASFDTITVKSAKFAVSSYVPIIGSHISDGFDLVLASMVLIKNSFGLITIFILLILIIAPVIKILILSFLLKIASSILEPLSDKRISSLLYDISKCLNLLIIVILGLAFIIFIMIILIIVTCNVGVM